MAQRQIFQSSSREDASGRRKVDIDAGFMENAASSPCFDKAVPFPDYSDTTCIHGTSPSSGFQEGLTSDCCARLSSGLCREEAVADKPCSHLVPSPGEARCCKWVSFERCGYGPCGLQGDLSGKTVHRSLDQKDTPESTGDEAKTRKRPRVADDQEKGGRVSAFSTSGKAGEREEEERRCEKKASKVGSGGRAARNCYDSGKDALPCNPFDCLPAGCMYTLFSFFDVGEIVRLRMISRAFRTFADAPCSLLQCKSLTITSELASELRREPRRLASSSDSGYRVHRKCLGLSSSSDSSAFWWRLLERPPHLRKLVVCRAVVPDPTAGSPRPCASTSGWRYLLKLIQHNASNLEELKITSPDLQCHDVVDWGVWTAQTAETPPPSTGGEVPEEGNESRLMAEGRVGEGPGGEENTRSEMEAGGGAKPKKRGQARGRRERLHRHGAWAGLTREVREGHWQATERTGNEGHAGTALRDEQNTKDSGPNCAAEGRQRLIAHRSPCCRRTSSLSLSSRVSPASDFLPSPFSSFLSLTNSCTPSSPSSRLFLASLASPAKDSSLSDFPAFLSSSSPDRPPSRSPDGGLSLASPDLSSPSQTNVCLSVQATSLLRPSGLTDRLFLPSCPRAAVRGANSSLSHLYSVSSSSSLSLDCLHGATGDTCLVTFPRLRTLSLFGCHAFCWIRLLAACRFPACRTFSVVNQCPSVHVAFGGLWETRPECREGCPPCSPKPISDRVAKTRTQAEQDLLQVLAAMPALQALRLETKLFVGRRIWRAVLGSGACGEPKETQTAGRCSPYLVELAIGDRAILHLADVVHELQNTPPAEGLVPSQVTSIVRGSEYHNQQHCHDSVEVDMSRRPVPFSGRAGRKTKRRIFTDSGPCDGPSDSSVRDRTTAGDWFCPSCSPGLRRRRPELLKLSVAGWGTGREKVPTVVLNSLEIVMKAYPRCEIALDSFAGGCTYTGRGPGDDNSGEENGPPKRVFPRLLQQLKHICLKYDDPDKDVLPLPSPAWSYPEEPFTRSRMQFHPDVERWSTGDIQTGECYACDVAAESPGLLEPNTLRIKPLPDHLGEQCSSVCCLMKSTWSMFRSTGPKGIPSCRPVPGPVRSCIPSVFPSDASCTCLRVFSQNDCSWCFPCGPSQKVFSVPARRVSIDFLHFSPLKHRSILRCRFGHFPPLCTTCGRGQRAAYPALRVLGLPESLLPDSHSRCSSHDLRRPARVSRRVCSVERRRGARKNKKKSVTPRSSVASYTSLPPRTDCGVGQGSSAARSTAVSTPRRRISKCLSSSSASRHQVASPPVGSNNICLPVEQGQLGLPFLSKCELQPSGDLTVQNSSTRLPGGHYWWGLRRGRQEGEEGQWREDLQRDKTDLVKRYVVPLLRSDVFQAFLLTVQKPPGMLEFFPVKERWTLARRERYGWRRSEEHQENCDSNTRCELRGRREAFLPGETKSRRKNPTGQGKRLDSVGQVMKTVTGVKVPQLTRVGGAQAACIQRKTSEEGSSPCGREKKASGEKGKTDKFDARNATEGLVGRLRKRVSNEETAQVQANISLRAGGEQTETEASQHPLKSEREADKAEGLLCRLEEAASEIPASASISARRAMAGVGPLVLSERTGPGTPSRKTRSFLVRRCRARQRVELELLQAILSEDLLKRKLKGLELQLEEVAGSTYTASVLTALSNLKNKRREESGENKCETCADRQKETSLLCTGKEVESAPETTSGQTQWEKEETCCLRRHSRYMRTEANNEGQEGDMQLQGRKGGMGSANSENLKSPRDGEGLGRKWRRQRAHTLSDPEIADKERSELDGGMHSQKGSGGQGAEEEREGENQIRSEAYGLGAVEAPRLEILRVVNLRLSQQDLLAPASQNQGCLVPPGSPGRGQCSSSLQGGRDDMAATPCKSKAAQQKSVSCPLIPGHRQCSENVTTAVSTNVTTGEKVVAILSEFLKAYPEVEHIEAEVPPFLFDPDEHPDHLEECQQLQAIEALMQALGYVKERVEVSGASAYAQVVLYKRKKRSEFDAGSVPS